MLIQIFSILGIIVSLYSVYLHKKVTTDKNYKAFCDINNRMSCSKVIKSKYSTIFGIQNGVYGILFYLTFIFVNSTKFAEYIFVMGMLALLSTFFFAYEQYFKVKNFCLVCNAIYVINIVLFLSSI